MACNLNELVSHVLELMEPELKHNQVSVNLDLDESLPNVSADPIQIEQVVLNLVKNAADAVSEHGNGNCAVTIATAASDRGQVELAVSDSGAGVPAENRDRVFDAFFTTKPDGMGMGLAISRWLVEVHGRRLWLTPNSARGCTFRYHRARGREKRSGPQKSKTKERPFSGRLSPLLFTGRQGPANPNVSLPLGRRGSLSRWSLSTWVNSLTPNP